MAHPRGDVPLIINGEEKTLRLTLGALADIETAFGGDAEALKTRLKNPRVGDVVVILHALLAGGGAGLSLAALKASDVNLSDAAAAIAKAFEALGESDGTAPGKSLSAAERRHGAL